MTISKEQRRYSARITSVLCEATALQTNLTQQQAHLLRSVAEQLRWFGRSQFERAEAKARKAQKYTG